MWKIQSCEVCEFCIFLYYARKSVTTFDSQLMILILLQRKYIRLAAVNVKLKVSSIFNIPLHCSLPASMFVTA